MFGYNRRPEPDTKRDYGMTGGDLLVAAVGTSWSTCHMEVQRAYARVFRGHKPAEDRDLLHAAVQIADLWAFETGRLP